MLDIKSGVFWFRLVTLGILLFISFQVNQLKKTSAQAAENASLAMINSVDARADCGSASNSCYDAKVSSEKASDYAEFCR